MKKNLEDKWKKLEAQRMAIFESISHLDNDAFNRKPAPDAWSIAQICQHLMQVESTSLSYLRKKVSHTTVVPRAGLKSWFRSRVLRFSFSFYKKIKAPAAVSQLVENVEKSSLKNAWASQRLDFHEFIELLPDRTAEGEIWKHPAVGKMSIAQMLDFFYNHVQRHHYQIKRTLDAIK